MRFIFSLFFLCVLFVGAQGQHITFRDLRDGDLLFQDLDCGDLCDAIESVTQSFDNRHFSHIGLVHRRADSVYLIEAIGKEVQLTPMAQFLSRSTNQVFVGILHKKHRHLGSKAVAFALSQLGVPYDDVFLYDNGKYYCSELLYEAYKAANKGKDFFSLEPMTFKIPASDQFFPVWIEYYEQLKLPIPQGQLGINPGGISRSPKLKIFPYQP